ncbi:MAG: aldo/keto reductase [Spirochaetaceae bacterium]|nr:MAG: aldo/keto reductase [Spirochaetaceae bacterium]
MKYRRLGRTAEKVSVVGMGTWQFGGEWGKEFAQSEVNAMFVAAREVGINLIDTAECYGDHLSEQFIGRALEETFPGEREKWFIATKFGHRFTGLFERDQIWDADGVTRQLEDSLRALRTDYVDLLQFHSGGDDVFDNPALWEQLAKLKAQGKVRHIGISIGANTNDYQTGKAPEVGAEAIQVVYNRLDRAPEEAVLPLCEQHDLGVLARVPLASGYLSGRYKPGASFDKTDVRSRHDREKVEERLREVEQIGRDEVPKGVAIAEWALAWCLKNPAVTAVIPGCKNVEQVKSNARAADLSDLVRDGHPQAVA